MSLGVRLSGGFAAELHSDSRATVPLKLAQVGKSSRRAYAYLTRTPKHRVQHTLLEL